MDNSKIEYHMNQPYPDICAERPNRIYAGAMLDNMAGYHSEMSAVSLYFFNSLAAYKYDDVAQAFHQISMVEMHHLEIFGILARQLGEWPRLWTRRGEGKVYWSPGYNHYPMPLRPMLMSAISGEKAAIRKYEAQARCIKDQNVVANLKRILADERLHAAILEQLFHRYFEHSQEAPGK